MELLGPLGCQAAQDLAATLQGLGKEAKLNLLAQCRSLESMQGDYLAALMPSDFSGLPFWDWIQESK